ncbi:MAG: hypothetical protein ACRYHA_04320 [Janthinobacterium lividum]
MPSTTMLPMVRLPIVVTARPVPFQGQLAAAKLFAIQCYHSGTRLAGFDERRGLLVDKNV